MFQNVWLDNMHRNHGGTAHGWGVSCCAQINAHPHVPVPAVGPESHWHWVTKSEWPTASFNLATKRHNKSNIGITKHQQNGGKMSGSIPQTGHLHQSTIPPSQVLTGDAHGEAPQKACCVVRCVTRSTPQGTCLEIETLCPNSLWTVITYGES